MRYSNDKEINRLVQRLVRAGGRYSSGRHGKLKPPHGRSFVTVPKTPSDWRTLRNLYRDLRRVCRNERCSQGIGFSTKDGRK